MALRNDGIEPGQYELRLRYGCGFTVGVALGAASWVRFGDFSWLSMVLAALGGGVVAGTLARHFGDRFWASLRWWS